MNLKEFIKTFSEEYYVAHLDDINNGCIITNITGDIYLVKDREVYDGE